MANDSITRNTLTLCALVLVAGALSLARSVFAPLAFSLFVIATVWPFQKAIQARVPKPVALIIVLLATGIIVALVTSVIAWSFGIEIQWLYDNASRFQTQYFRLQNWLEQHHVVILRSLAEGFDVMWLVRAVRGLASGLNGLFGFAFITTILTTIGLLEVDDCRRRVESLTDRVLAQRLLRIGEETSAKFRKYVVVRTLMSALTGLLTWGVALLVHVPYAGSWGGIAFALNYIPFIGSFIASVLPAVFTAMQFGSWQKGVIVLLALMAIQALVGSYLEPLLSGSMLNISPFAVVVVVFLWNFLWGIPGTVIGVPLTLAFLTACEHSPATRWIAMLLSGGAPKTRTEVRVES